MTFQDITLCLYHNFPHVDPPMVTSVLINLGEMRTLIYDKTEIKH
jgi:hypothetical protein